MLTTILKPKVNKVKTSTNKSKGFFHHVKSNTLKVSPKVLSIIDSIGVVSLEYEIHNAEVKRLGGLLKGKQQELLTELEEDFTEVPSTVTGKKYTVSISEPGNVSELVDKELAIHYLDIIEEGLAFTLLKFNLGDLKMYLTKEQYEEVVHTSKTGNRAIKIISS